MTGRSFPLETVPGLLDIDDDASVIIIRSYSNIRIRFDSLVKRWLDARFEIRIQYANIRFETRRNSSIRSARVITHWDGPNEIRINR